MNLYPLSCEVMIASKQVYLLIGLVGCGGGNVAAE
jgi:hypothetical protein